jgi:hypothetical protein
MGEDPAFLRHIETQHYFLRYVQLQSRFAKVLLAPQAKGLGRAAHLDA